MNLTTTTSRSILHTYIWLFTKKIPLGFVSLWRAIKQWQVAISLPARPQILPKQQNKSDWKKERRRRKINPPITVSSGSPKQEKKNHLKKSQPPPPQNYPTCRNLSWSRNVSPSLFSSTKSPVKQTVYQTLLQRGRSDLLLKHSLQRPH